MPDRHDRHDDASERRLAQRLRAYESRLPDAEPPPPGTRPARGRALWPWLVGSGAAAAVAGVVLALLIVIPQRAEVGEATPAASPSATPRPEASASPREEATPGATASAIESSAPAPTLIPTPGPIVRWTTARSFGSEGFAEEVRDIAYGGGHFVAVGYREPLDQRGQVAPPQHDPLIWISADGSSWELLDLGAEFDGAQVFAVVALPDGTAGIYGYVDHDPDPANEDLEPVGWRSPDGGSWSRFELALPLRPGDVGYPPLITHVAEGRKGYLTAQTFAEGEQVIDELWYSADGASWTTVRRFGEDGTGWTDHIRSFDAGDEGFVLTGERFEIDAEERVYHSFVEASSNGRTWIKAAPGEMPEGENLLVAAVGGDWIVTQTDFEASTDVTWFSHNGLDWEERSSIEVPMPAGADQVGTATVAVIGQVVGAGDRAFITGALTYCCHGPWFAAGVWSSFDAGSWERLGFPEDTVIEAAASHAGVTVLAGYTGATPKSGWQARATFWVSERE